MLIEMLAVEPLIVGNPGVWKFLINAHCQTLTMHPWLDCHQYLGYSLTRKGQI